MNINKQKLFLFVPAIAVVAFASYEMGALRHPAGAHALAATTAGTANAKAAGSADTAGASGNVQIQVGQSESIQQWQGTSAPANTAPTTSAPSRGSSSPPTGPSTPAQPAPSTGGLPPNVASLLKSLGIQLNFAQGGKVDVQHVPPGFIIGKGKGHGEHGRGKGDMGFVFQQDGGDH
ncbi:hypothetical protein LLE49_00790 [Alicyclobacillus tolerans]|uniref:hypothetical protein n=1 Tax=Alicyclobacillus tolerans TaxID=90970 RepID=UPI001F22B1AF|nr:hypothetical protein [Alicyclobacillus tolerans]MCF8563281.1 hypothetical protein [Alicyclobacillus tolerans]